MWGPRSSLVSMVPGLGDAQGVVGENRKGKKDVNVFMRSIGPQHSEHWKTGATTIRQNRTRQMTLSQLWRLVAVGYRMQLVYNYIRMCNIMSFLNCPGGKLSLFLIEFNFCSLSSACDSSSTAPPLLKVTSQSSAYFQALQVGYLKTKVQASFFSAEVLGLKP